VTKRAGRRGLKYCDVYAFDVLYVCEKQRYIYKKKKHILLLKTQGHGCQSEDKGRYTIVIHFASMLTTTLDKPVRICVCIHIKYISKSY